MDPELHLDLTAEYIAESDEALVRVLLFNFSDDPVVVNGRFALNGPGMPGEVSLRVIAPSGRSVSFSARSNVGKPNEDHFTSVLPWNCVGRQFDLYDYYRIGQDGIYRITARYENKWSGKEFGLEAWTGELESRVVELNIPKSESGRR